MAGHTILWVGFVPEIYQKLGSFDSQFYKDFWEDKYFNTKKVIKIFLSHIELSKTHIDYFKKQNEKISCDGTGVQAVIDNCTIFVNCYNGSGVVQSCPLGTYFHETCIQNDNKESW